VAVLLGRLAGRQAVADAQRREPERDQRRVHRGVADEVVQPIKSPVVRHDLHLADLVPERDLLARLVRPIAGRRALLRGPLADRHRRLAFHL
jgi:hypothetical protein